MSAAERSIDQGHDHDSQPDRRARDAGRRLRPRLWKPGIGQAEPLHDRQRLADRRAHLVGWLRSAPRRRRSSIGLQPVAAQLRCLGLLQEVLELDEFRTRQARVAKRPFGLLAAPVLAEHVG